MGRRKYTRSTLRMIFSKGKPCFSYIAMRKQGSITSTIHSAAVLTPVRDFKRKKSGTPISAPQPKHISCRFVRLNRTFVFTAVKSLGTGTYATVAPPIIVVFHSGASFAPGIVRFPAFCGLSSICRLPVLHSSNQQRAGLRRFRYLRCR